MTTAPFAPRDTDVTDVIDVADDPVVEPAALAWHRRLVGTLPSDGSSGQTADLTASLVAEELAADHVALWGREGEEYVVLGAMGFSAGARRMRLPTDYPVVNVCNGSGGRILRDDDNHQGPRAPGLPGSSSRAYAMVMLDDAGPVELLTISGRRLLADEVEAVCELASLVFGDRPQGH